MWLSLRVCILLATMNVWVARVGAVAGLAVAFAVDFVVGGGTTGVVLVVIVCAPIGLLAVAAEITHAGLNSDTDPRALDSAIQTSYRPGLEPGYLEHLWRATVHVFLCSATCVPLYVGVNGYLPVAGWVNVLLGFTSGVSLMYWVRFYRWVRADDEKRRDTVFDVLAWQAAGGDYLMPYVVWRARDEQRRALANRHYPADHSDR